jgi:hypothetical protein
VTAGASISGTAVTADLNADGKTDLAIFNTTGLFTVLLGNADGSFTSVTNPSIRISKPPAIGDFNGDGKVDLVCDSGILLGNGDGTFIAAPSLVLPAYPVGTCGSGGLIYFPNTLSVATTDLNGDGLSDVLMGISVDDLKYTGTTTYGVTAFLSQPTATATSSVHFVSLGTSYNYLTAAYSGDTAYSASTVTQYSQHPRRYSP